ncbi:MAG TPA: EamA family transporter [Bacillota bacterium]|nr:EamA family transporter [Bacillota bacterium]
MNTGVIFIAITAILWGTSGISAKYLINTYALSPLAIAALRLLIAAPVLLIMAKLESKTKVKIAKRHYALCVIYGITIASYQITYFSAVENIMVSIATLLALCTAPIFVAILSGIFLKERMTNIVRIALVLSIIGTTLTINITGVQFQAGSNFWGYPLALAAGLSYAVYTLCGRGLAVHYPPARVMSVTVSLGALITLPFLRVPGNLPWEAWGILLYLGVVPTAIAYILFTRGLKKSTATQASIATLFEPLTSTILSVLLLNEKFSQGQVFGAVLLASTLLLLVFKDYFEALGGTKPLADSD